MIIECEQCKSKFKLDEGLLREEGTKVRCSQCKHVFKAFPPSLSPQEPELVEMESFEETSTVETVAGSGPDRAEPITEIYEDYGEAIEENYGEAIEENYGEAIEENYGEAIEENYGEASEENYGEASEKNYGEASEDAFPRVDLDKDREIEAVPFEKKAEPVLGMEEPAKAKTKPLGAIPGKPKMPAKHSKVRKPGKSPLLPAILIVLVLLLGGATAVYFFAPQYIPESVFQFMPFLKGAETREIRDPGIRRLSFKAITGRFAESTKAGQLFVVKGIVVNNYSSSRSYILVKGSILDDKGKVVKTKLTYAGNTFTDDEIKQLSDDRINQAMRNRPGKGNMNLNVQPQAAIPFMLVFDKLPDNLSEFTVEAVSSSPGK
jgi:predicted Zn finger-like uncharacterized protein